MEQKPWELNMEAKARLCLSQQSAASLFLSTTLESYKSVVNLATLYSTMYEQYVTC